MSNRQPTDETTAELARLQLEVERLARENAELRSRSRFDEQLHSDAARYEVIVANLAAGVVLQLVDGQILTCNAAAERILGLTLDQMTGRTSMDARWMAIHEDGSPFPGETHPAMVSLRTGLPVHDAIMGVHKPDGALTWISINSQPLFAGGQTKPYAVVTTFVDITTLKRSQERARDSEDKLRFAMEAARMGTWEWDILADDIRFSDNVEVIFGLEPGSFEGTYEHYLALVHPEDRGPLDAAVARTLADRTSDDYVNEHRVVGVDGEARWIGSFGRVFRNERGEAVRMAGTLTDISGRKSLESQLMLAQRMETVGRLAGGVAHDFNNLLTAILGCAELAAMHSGLPADVVESLDTISDASEKAAGLTRQLLSFARRQVFDLRVLDLRALILDIERLLSRVIGDHIRVTTSLVDVSVPIRADQAQIEQVLVNLAVNARDAMRDGGTLEIALTVEELGPTGSMELLPSGCYALLRVSDSGCGIAPADLPHVFDPFFTTKPEGTGLGLATCYGIVKQLGGEILVESEPGCGAQFSIYLPLSSEQIDSAGIRTRPSSIPGRGRILLAEDDAVVRLLAERGLRASGYEVIAVTDGRAALELLDRQPQAIDLLISDLMMPNMTGFALAERLRERLPELRVVFVSGYAEGIEYEEIRRGLADAVYLPKPYTIARLLEVVGGMLG